MKMELGPRFVDVIIHPIKKLKRYDERYTFWENDGWKR